MSDNLTPSVRFDGFTNDWEQRRIQDFCKVTSGEFVIKTKQDDSYPYPVYNGGKTNTGYYSEYNQTGNKVIISARGAAGFVNRSATAFWAGNSCHSIEVLDESDWIFLYYALKVRENQLIRDQQTATIPSVSKKQVLETTVALPSVEEQKVISSFLGSIDSTLTLCQRKLDLLTQAKKALMQQLFSQKLRFKADDGSDFPEWTTIKVEDAAENFTGGGTPSTTNSDYYQGPIPWISSSDLVEDDIDSITPAHFITKEAIDQSATKLIQSNSVLVVLRVGVGKVALSTESLCTSQDFISLENVRGSARFLAYLLSYRMQEEKKQARGTSIKGIPASEFKKMRVSIPQSMFEQQKIASCLSSADALIDQARVELEQWQEVKKSLLQQLFV